MKTFHLKILMNSNNEHYEKRNQFITERVEAHALEVTGDGRVYRFRDSVNLAIAFYPTASTIIEKITYND